MSGLPVLVVTCVGPAYIRIARLSRLLVLLLWSTVVAATEEGLTSVMSSHLLLSGSKGGWGGGPYGIRTRGLYLDRVALLAD